MYVDFGCHSRNKWYHSNSFPNACLAASHLTFINVYLFKKQTHTDFTYEICLQLHRSLITFKFLSSCENHTFYIGWTSQNSKWNWSWSLAINVKVRFTTVKGLVMCTITLALRRIHVSHTLWCPAKNKTKSKNNRADNFASIVRM